jgi:hypothetical protein
MSIIDDVFAPLYGKPCWSVQPGIGSFLTFEFGEPYLKIREPKEARISTSPKVRRRLARRDVSVRGAWHLWISFCGWRFYLHDKEIGSSIASKRVIKRVAAEVDGQALIKVTVEEDGVTAFQFDLGGYLETYPFISTDELPDEMDCWTLFEPTGKALTLRMDIKYCYKSSRKPCHDEDWFHLFPKTT